MFHSFFYLLARSKYLSFFSHSFSFILWLSGTAKSTIIIIIIIINNNNYHYYYYCYYYYYYYLLISFSHQLTLMVFHRSLSDINSPQVSRTLFSILADLKNVIVCMVFTCPAISKSSSPFINDFVTVPEASITIGINVTFMFHSFFNSLEGRGIYPFFSPSFNFTQWSAVTASPQFFKFSFFCWLL